MCSYVCTYVITPKQTLRSVQTGSYLKYTLQCSVPVVIAMRKSIRGRVSPFRMQREPAPWPSPALSRLLLACPFALWMRQSPAYRPPAERPNQCFVHTEMPPRQHYHRPARWRQSKRERERKEQTNFNVTHRSINCPNGHNDKRIHARQMPNAKANMQLH